MWAPNGNVESAWSNCASAERPGGPSSPSRRPGGASFAREASSAHVRARAGTPATPTVPVGGVDEDVGLGGFEQVGGEALGLADEHLGRLVHRRAAELQRTRPSGASAARDEVGVAVDEADAVDRDAGLIADEHGERGLMALAVGERAGPDGGRAVVVDLDRAELAGAATGGDLDVGGDADPERHPVAASPALGLLAAEVGVAAHLGGDVERGVVRAAVVGGSGQGLEREHVVGEEVAPPQLDRVDVQLESGVIDEPFEQGRGFGPPGAAVRAHRGRVGDGDGHVELDRGEVVGAVGHALGAGRQEGADAGVGATVAEQAYPQTGERAVGAAAEFGVLHLPAAVRLGHEVVAARRRPRHRPPEVSGGGGDG